MSHKKDSISFFTRAVQSNRESTKTVDKEKDPESFKFTKSNDGFYHLTLTQHDRVITFNFDNQLDKLIAMKPNTEVSGSYQEFEMLMHKFFQNLTSVADYIKDVEITTKLSYGTEASLSLRINLEQSPDPKDDRELLTALLMQVNSPQPAHLQAASDMVVLDRMIKRTELLKNSASFQRNFSKKSKHRQRSCFDSFLSMLEFFLSGLKEFALNCQALGKNITRFIYKHVSQLLSRLSVMLAPLSRGLEKSFQKTAQATHHIAKKLTKELIKNSSLILSKHARKFTPKPRFTQ